MQVNGGMCPEEHSQQSPHSPNPPGIILPSETIGRVIIAPEHYDAETGSIKPAAFRTDELLQKRLSVQRLVHTSSDELNDLANQLSSNREENQFMGISVACVDKVRSVVDGFGQQCFCVVDDGLECNRAHALVGSAISMSRTRIKKVRKLLMDEFLFTAK